MLDKFRSLFSLRRLPGLALTLLGLVGTALHRGWHFLDIFGRVDVLWHIVQAMGGTAAMIAGVVASPWFSFSLIAAGIAYTVFVGEPERGVQRHPWWPYVGWSVFAVCLTAMILVPTYGAIELHIRQEIAKGISGIPRNTPDVNIPNRPQTPTYVENWAVLTPDQIRILIQELPKLRPILPDPLYFSTVPNENAGYGYWTRFEDVFVRSGIVVAHIGQRPRGPEEEGLMLVLRDTSAIPIAAQKLREAFEVANISMKVIAMPEGMPAGTEFLVFIGPRPIRWR